MRHDIDIADHYSRGDLAARIDKALADAGRDLDNLSLDDLSAVGEFHLRGKEATHELARRAQVVRGSSVVDVGGGLGGPARTVGTMLRNLARNLQERRVEVVQAVLRKNGS